MKKITSILALIAVTFSAMVIAPSAFAADIPYYCSGGPKAGMKVKAPSDCSVAFPDGTPYTEDQGDLSHIFTNIVNVIIGVVGFIAILMIVVGGIMYATSTGDSPKVKKAKDTIVYGIIGLVIALLAFAIVNFVLANL